MLFFEQPHQKETFHEIILRTTFTESHKSQHLAVRATLGSAAHTCILHSPLNFLLLFDGFCFTDSVWLSSVMLHRCTLSLMHADRPHMTYQLVDTALHHRHDVVAWYCISCPPPPFGGMAGAFWRARESIFPTRHARNNVTCVADFAV